MVELGIEPWTKSYGLNYEVILLLVEVTSHFLIIFLF